MWLFFYKDINKGKIGKKGEEIGVVNREYLQFGKEQGEKREDFSEELLDWFRKNGRTLPWRGKKNAYYTWLSEIMLQQTRVEAVKGYFYRFIERLPDIASLSLSEEEEVLKLWEGLGYYSRARNLHKGAKLIMERFHGEMPAEYSEIRALPGIGDYTAAAISSIVFSEKIPAVDGNLLRIFARLNAYEGDILSKEAKDLAFRYFQERMDESFPGDFNEALMDLGAMVCVPKGQIQCGSCPLSSFCLGLKEGRQENYPKKREKKERKKEKYSIFLIRLGEKIVLKKRPKKGVLAGLYGFYQLPGFLNKKEALEEVKKLGFIPLKLRELGSARHIFTHKEWEMIGYEVECGEFPLCEELREETELFTKEEIESNLSIPSAFSYYKNFL